MPAHRVGTQVFESKWLQVYSWGAVLGTHESGLKPSRNHTTNPLDENKRTQWGAREQARDMKNRGVQVGQSLVFAPSAKELGPELRDTRYPRRALNQGGGLAIHEIPPAAHKG